MTGLSYETCKNLSYEERFKLFETRKQNKQLSEQKQLMMKIGKL